jgi:alpha-tubulin suppressor-like RCC1 family protein
LESGGLRCWGANFYDQLGDPYWPDGYFTPDFWTSPPIEDTTSGIASVSAGRTHTCAVTTTGSLRCWGDNYYGELGDESGPFGTGALDHEVLTNVAEVSAGTHHTCALTKAGGVRCWGANSYGQLGTGNENQLLTPPANDVVEGAVQVAAGDVHTCALLAAGTVSCWGWGYVSGNSQDDQHFASDMGLSGVRAITSGGNHACALLENGGVRCWGSNLKGQLGQPQTVQVSVQPTAPFLADIAAISAGDEHTCAVSVSGDVYCWGANEYGQSGRELQGGAELPIETPVLLGASSVSSGESHTCALLEDGAVQCWGKNDFGQLGDGTQTTRMAAVRIRSFCPPTAGVGFEDEPVRTCPSGAPLTVKQVAAGWGFNCALLSSGSVRCWGANSNGGLGDGTTVPRSLPGGDVLQDVKAVTAGASHVCALMNSGGLRCWGANYRGTLGDGTTIDKLVPPDIDGLGNVQAVSAHFHHTCALAAGQVRCWGSNEHGQLGDGSAMNPESFRTSPTPPLEGVADATAIETGESSCALTASGPICWGQPWNFPTPTPIAASGSVRSLALGYGGCFVLSSNLVECRSRMIADTLSNVKDLTIASPRCALLTTGDLHCWGDNTLGSLGDSTRNSRFNMGPPILRSATAVSSKNDHACAILRNGQLRCWGNNMFGQLGDGTTTHRAHPVPGPTFCP